MTGLTFKMRQKQRREQEILVAAREAFGEGGCSGLNLDEIAQRTGIAKGTLYAHFEGKDDLLGKLLEQSANRLLSELTEAMAGSDDPMEKLARVLTVMLRAHGPAPELLPAVEPRLSCYLRTFGRVPDCLREVDGFIGGLIDKGKSQGQIDADLDTGLSVQALRALASIDVFRDTDVPKQNQAVKFLVQLLCRGLLAENRSPIPESDGKQESHANSRDG